MQLFGLAVAFLIVTRFLSVPALADTLADCRQSRDQRLRLAACTIIISDKGSTPADKAVAYRLRGRARAQAGALNQALTDISAALTLNPADDLSLVTRALVRVQTQDLDGAIADYTAAIAVQPRSTMAYNGRGHAHLVKGDTQRALADFSAAIDISPKSARAYNNRGLAHRKTGKLTKAIEDYTRAIAINPIYALAYANRGYALEARGRKTAAVADFRRALLLDPSLSGARDGLSRLNALGPLAAQSERLIDAGRKLAQASCGSCHGLDQATASPNPRAPTFRGLHARHPAMALREPLTRAIFAPHDVMPKFALSNEKIDSIVAYINSLSAGR